MGLGQRGGWEERVFSLQSTVHSFRERQKLGDNLTQRRRVRRGREEIPRREPGSHLRRAFVMVGDGEEGIGYKSLGVRRLGWDTRLRLSCGLRMGRGCGGR